MWPCPEAATAVWVQHQASQQLLLMGQKGMIGRCTTRAWVTRTFCDTVAQRSQEVRSCASDPWREPAVYLYRWELTWAELTFLPRDPLPCQALAGTGGLR